MEEYRNELVKRMKSFYGLSDLIETLEEANYSKEEICRMIERNINLLNDAFEDYRNPPKSIIKGKLKLESNDKENLSRLKEETCC